MSKAGGGPFLQRLSHLVPGDAMRISRHARRAYGAGYFGHNDAEKPLAIVLPENTEQVQAVIRHCKDHGVPVIPRGAGTNLVGAAIPVHESVMIATTRMKRVLEFDPVAGAIRVEAGVTNLAVSAYVRSAGWRYAPDPSSRRTCTIGGNIATNSSGASCLKYGMTANNVAGLTVVLPDGERVETGNGGYEVTGADIAGILCGSEGQMGLVTEALLRLVPRARQVCSIMLSYADPRDGLSAASDILRLGIVPARFDYVDAATIRLCENYVPSGYPANARAILLLDIEGLPLELVDLQGQICEAAGSFCEMHVEREHEARAELWAGRMKIYGAAAARGRHVALDGAVPLSKFPDILETIDRETANRSMTAATALPIGDGTVHAFLFENSDHPESSAITDQCATAIRLACIELGGSLSSEYGIGIRTQDLLTHQYSRVDLAVQQRCIDAVQAGALFNPGKVFPSLSGAAE